MKHLTFLVFFFFCFALAGSGLRSMQRSLYIHLLSLLPWQGEEELCLQKSSSAAATSRRRHGDDGPSQRASEHDCTVRQTCRKGRRDVLFSHPTPPDKTPPTHRRLHSLCCVRGVGISLVQTPAHAEWAALRHAQRTVCLRRASGSLFQYPDVTAVKTPPFFPIGRRSSTSYMRRH